MDADEQQHERLDEAGPSYWYPGYAADHPQETAQPTTPEDEGLGQFPVPKAPAQPSPRPHRRRRVVVVGGLSLAVLATAGALAGTGAVQLPGSSPGSGHTAATGRGTASTTSPSPTHTRPPRVKAGKILAWDSFDRRITGGWGVTVPGGRWSAQYVPAAYSVTGGTGRIALPSGGVTRAAWLSGLVEPDVVVSVDVALSALPRGGQSMWVYVDARRRAPTLLYRARLRVFGDGGVRLAIVRRAGTGQDVVVGKEAFLTRLVPRAGGPVRIRFEVSGTDPTVLRAKAWPASDPEPAAWPVDTRDGTPELQLAGSVGVAAYAPKANGKATFSLAFSHLSVAEPIEAG